MLEESSKLYVSDPYEFPLCALRICSVSHSNPEGLRTHPDVCFCLPNSLPGSHQPRQVSSAASPDLSCVSFTWDILLSAAGGLWRRSCSCTRLLVCSLWKGFLSLSTLYTSGRNSSLCSQIPFLVEGESFYLPASAFKTVQEGQRFSPQTHSIPLLCSSSSGYFS